MEVGQSAESFSINPPSHALNKRAMTIVMISACVVIVAFILVYASASGQNGIEIRLQDKNLPPSVSHPFGTDWMGRDMFARTMKGLTLSMTIGCFATVISVIISTIMGLLCAFSKQVDAIVSWIIDLFLGVPHLVLLIMISFVLGGGARGVIVGLGLTHWPSLTRVIRAEVLLLRDADFIRFSRFGNKGMWFILSRHIFPHLLPPIFVGAVLLFPHAILHEAAITFLGMGLPADTPAVGVILSESMRYLSLGRWWLAFFPGLSLLILVRCVDSLMDNIRSLVDPQSARL